MLNIRCSTSKAKIMNLVCCNEILMIYITSLDCDGHTSLRDLEG